MLTVDRIIKAPPSAVWQLFIDLDAWPRWGPPIRRAELDDLGAGLKLHATGRVYTYLPIGLPFVITEFEPQRSWAWTVAGIPATRHQVEPVAGGTRTSIAVPWWAAAYLSVCAVALRRMEQLATRS
jgi:uncharacterized protein YndB with AHSA1/START domain